MPKREAKLRRTTNETSINLRLCLDGNGGYKIDTGGAGFFNHMLDLFARHSGIDLLLEAKGDLHVDDHHLVEDVGIALGTALAEALGDKAGIERYGSAIIPMDEVLALAAVDLSGRFAYVGNYKPQRDQVGDFSTEMVDHFFASVASAARLNLHLRILVEGSNEHHRIEALFKAFARALKVAVRVNPESAGVIPSTKGVLQ